MSKVKKVSYVPWLGTPLNNQVFKDDLGNWEYILKNNLQKRKIEIGTSDVLPIEDADAAIMFDNVFYKNLDAIWKMYDAHILHKSIYIDYEPPTGHCKNHSSKGIKRLSRIFKKVITYNDDLVDGEKIIKGSIANFYSKELSYKHDFKKRKFITMVTNNTGVDRIIHVLNCSNASNYYNRHNIKDHKHALYSKRKEAAYFFMEKCPHEFDLYGANWPDEFKPVLKGVIDKKNKCQTLSKYKFIVSYDSFQKQNGYISEKIFDAFHAKTVPIYWGADNIEKYIPKDCYIDKREFRTYEQLYDYLKSMTEEEYEMRIKAIEKYLKSDLYINNFSSKASAKILEDAVLSNDINFSYEKAYKELMYFQNKKEKVDKHPMLKFYISQILENATKVELIFYVDDFACREEVDYQVYCNGMQLKKEDFKVIKNPGFSNQIEFKVTIIWNGNPVSININHYHKGEVKSVEFSNTSEKLSKKYGLLVSRDYKTITYYNYYGLSGNQRFSYLMKYHNYSPVFFISHVSKYVFSIIKSYFKILCNKIKVIFRGRK